MIFSMTALIKSDIFLIISLCITVVLAIGVVINTIFTLGIKKKYNKLLNEIDSGIGAQLDKYFKEKDELIKKYNDLRIIVNEMTKIQDISITKVGIIRYNAFENVGSDLSFSIALLNSKDNGFVISGLYSRDSSSVYAKPIQEGKSSYKLSNEEMKAIEIAIKNHKELK